ncbi:MAG TPA: cupin domain-containing protein [Burkholderiales bacterium]|nr:cupin domain-containing protein [Burkholderiales bacterium]
MKAPFDLTRGRVVSGGGSYQSEQGSVYAPGISKETVGSTAVFLGRVALPPGGRTKAHVHERHESAFYFVSGENVELWTGDRLQHRNRANPGDYLFIPANVPHVAVNRSEHLTAVFIGVRNEPTAQESVVMRPELDALVP